MIGRFLKSDLEKFVKVIRSIYVLLLWSSNTKQSTTKLVYSKFQETIERLRYNHNSLYINKLQIHKKSNIHACYIQVLMYSPWIEKGAQVKIDFSDLLRCDTHSLLIKIPIWQSRSSNAGKKINLQKIPRGVFKVRWIDLNSENESQMNIYAFYITT